MSSDSVLSNSDDDQTADRDLTNELVVVKETIREHDAWVEIKYSPAKQKLGL